MRWELVARAQGGVVDRAQLAEAGLSDRQIDGMVARTEIVPVLPSVYRSAAAPDTDAGRWWAAVLWSGGVLSHQSAAAAQGVPCEGSARVHVSVPDIAYRRPPAPWVRVHRVQLRLDECTRVADLPVTDRLRTVTDLLGTLPLRDGRTLLGWAMRHDVARVTDLDRRLVDGRGRSGNVRIRKLRTEADPNAQAEFERRVHRLLRERGITGWEPQFPVLLPSGALIHVDLAFPDARLIVELDGWAFHNGLGRFRKDRKRWRGAAAMKWTVVQFTWDDLDNPDALIAEILQLLAASRSA